jgi:hypothetical protein
LLTALERAIAHLRLAIDSAFDRINEAIGLRDCPRYSVQVRDQWELSYEISQAGK